VFLSVGVFIYIAYDDDDDGRQISYIMYQRAPSVVNVEGGVEGRVGRNEGHIGLQKC